jgi:hypothetical protein
MSKLQQLCDELELTVLIDGGDARGQRRYALIWTEDRSAGISGSVVTPWFASRQALEGYCEAHYQRIIEEGAPEVV